jgi:hypothetical protein
MTYHSLQFLDEKALDTMASDLGRQPKEAGSMIPILEDGERGKPLASCHGYSGNRYLASIAERFRARINDKLTDE